MRAQLLSLRSFAVAGFAALAALTVVNCGNAVAACDAKCDCEKCPTSEYNACLATGESDAHAALQAGCTTELDDLQSCQATTGVCKGNELETKCGTQKDRLKTCLDPKK